MGIDRLHIATALATAVAVALLFPAVRHLREQPPPPPPAVRLSLTAPPGTELGAGDEPLDAAISPDQREVVFVATSVRRSAVNQGAAGSTQLWRRRLDAVDAEPIPGTEGARLPAWKRTGNVLSFFADARLKLLNLKTGSVTDVAEAPAPAGATWLRDGSLLFVPAAGPLRRLLDGRITDATKLAAGDTAHAFPVTAAGGDDFTYMAVRDDGRRMVRLSAGGQETDVGTTAAHGALPDPRWFLFVKDTTLLGDYRDGEGRLAGRDLPLILNVGTTQDGRGLFVASADVLIHAGAAERPRRIAWLDMGGIPTGTVGDAGDYWQVRLSPDDRSVAVTARDLLLRSLDVLMIPAAEASQPAPPPRLNGSDRSMAVRLTTSVAADTDPVWSQDGGRILFRSLQRGRPEMFITPAGIIPGVELPARPVSTAGEVPTDWRGTEILTQVRGNAGFDLIRVDQATQAVERIADSPFNETDGRWSPDGRWIAYVSDEPGRPDIYVHNTGGERQRVSFGGGTHPRWARDSRALLFLRESTIMSAELVSGTARFGSPRPLFEATGVRDFDVSRRSNRFVALLAERTRAVSDVSVVMNWRSLLVTAERQPTKIKRQRPAL